jgi:hypothetical protein
MAKNLTDEERAALRRYKRELEKYKSFLNGPFGDWLEVRLKTMPVGDKVDLGFVLFLKVASDKLQLDFVSKDGPKSEILTISKPFGEKEKKPMRILVGIKKKSGKCALCGNSHTLRFAGKRLGWICQKCCEDAGDATQILLGMNRQASIDAFKTVLAHVPPGEISLDAEIVLNPARARLELLDGNDRYWFYLDCVVRNRSGQITYFQDGISYTNIPPGKN